MIPATQPGRARRQTAMRAAAIGSGLFLFAVAAPAWAHPGHDAHGASFTSGLLHPFGGLDHLLAMLAVGLWAAQQGQRAFYAVPAAFVAAMAAGFGLGLGGLTLPFAETGIALSVLALGLAVALAFRPPLALAMLATAGFALFHGYAHALEMSGGAFGYGAGMLLGTALLHGLGLGLALLAAHQTASLKLTQHLTRGAGAATAAIGLVLLVL